MFGFKKKPVQPKTEVTQTTTPVSIRTEEKLQILEKLIIEQRSMIRELLTITTMLSEHKRYELIQVKLHKLANMIDKIR